MTEYEVMIKIPPRPTIKDRHALRSGLGGRKQRRLYKRWFFAKHPPLPGWPSTFRVYYPHQHAEAAWTHP